MRLKCALSCMWSHLNSNFVILSTPCMSKLPIIPSSTISHLHGLPPPCSHSLQRIGNSGVEIKMLWKLKLGQPWKTMVGRVRVRGQYHRKQSQRGLQLPFFGKHPFYFPHNKGDFNCMFSFFFFFVSLFLFTFASIFYWIL